MRLRRRTPRVGDPHEPGGSPSPTARLLPVLVPVAAAGTALTAFALGSILTRDLSVPGVVGALVLLAAATAAEAFPVPMGHVSAGGVSLAAAFLVGAALIYDWRTAVLLSAATRVSIELIQRRPLVKVVFNGAVFALSGGAAGFASRVAGDWHSIGGLLITVLAASAAFYVVNVPLVAAIVARATGGRFADILRESVRWTGIPFAIMASLSLMLQVLWERSPVLAAALAGPLIAVALYQRSMYRALEATRLARTDALTGLGNHRAFQESLSACLASGDVGTLCVLDADGFKRVNDRHGHPAGDAVLVHVATLLRGDGEAFRLGGDEFAILLPGRTLADGREIAETVVDRIGLHSQPFGGSVTVSAGVAQFPEHGTDPDRVFAAADAALYQAKRRGRNQVQAFDPALTPIAPRQDAAEAALLKAAWGLAELIDAADGLAEDDDTSSDGHSRRVSSLAARLAERVGLAPEEVEHVRLAARLHDLGKLAVPVELLTKPGSLAAREWRVLAEHPEIGRRILSALGADAIAEWVLHHHERWDGDGYPNGLAADAIPLPARIIFVADAFDAMVSGRPYRAARSEADAVAELVACAGTQFDPGVVAALVAELDSDETLFPLTA